MSLEKEEKFGTVGCLAVAGIVAVAGLGYYFWSQHGGGSSPGVEVAADAPPPITHVRPARKKTTVKKAAKLDPLGEKINTGDDAPPPSAVGDVVASVDNLGTLTSLPPETQAAVASVDVTLTKQPLCYHGKIPHRGPSLYDEFGFSISYGPDDLTSPDSMPRLEVFFDPDKQPPTATYVSLADAPVEGFSPHETQIAYSEDTFSKMIAAWIAATATDRCPARKPLK